MFGKYTGKYEYFNNVTKTSIKSNFIRGTEEEVKECIALLKKMVFEDLMINDSEYKEEYVIYLDEDIKVEVYKYDNM